MDRLFTCNNMQTFGKYFNTNLKKLIRFIHSIFTPWVHQKYFNLERNLP